MPQAAQHPLNLMPIRFLVLTLAAVTALLLGGCGDSRQPPKYPPISEIHLVPKAREYILSDIVADDDATNYKNLLEQKDWKAARNEMNAIAKKLLVRRDNSNGLQSYKVTMTTANDGIVHLYGSISIDGSTITLTEANGPKRIGKYNGERAYLMKNGDLTPSEFEWEQVEALESFYDGTDIETKKPQINFNVDGMDSEPVLYTNKESALNALKRSEDGRIAKWKFLSNKEIKRTDEMEARETEAKKAEEALTDDDRKLLTTIEDIGKGCKAFSDPLFISGVVAIIKSLDSEAIAAGLGCDFQSFAKDLIKKRNEGITATELQKAISTYHDKTTDVDQFEALAQANLNGDAQVANFNKRMIEIQAARDAFKEAALEWAKPAK